MSAFSGVVGVTCGSSATRSWTIVDENSRKYRHIARISLQIEPNVIFC
jgi:hypothetical protein